LKKLPAHGIGLLRLKKWPLEQGLEIQSKDLIS
jgi:hypothetical protein